MAAPFAPGDVVQLKSGGPQMTVELIDDTGMVACTWMDGTKLERRSFVAATLTIYKARPAVVALSSRRRKLDAF